MKQTITQYVITDPDKKFFWQRIIFYDHSATGPIYHAKFADQLFDANFMSQKLAESTLENLRNLQLWNDCRVDMESLIMLPITITYEL